MTGGDVVYADISVRSPRQECAFVVRIISKYIKVSLKDIMPFSNQDLYVRYRQEVVCSND